MKFVLFMRLYILLNLIRLLYIIFFINVIFRFRNISRDYLLENLKFNPDTKQWGVEIDTIGKYHYVINHYVKGVPHHIISRQSV